MTVEIEGQGLAKMTEFESREANEVFETFPAPGPVNRELFAIETWGELGRVINDPVTGALFEV